MIYKYLIYYSSDFSSVSETKIMEIRDMISKYFSQKLVAGEVKVCVEKGITEDDSERY